MPTMHFEGSHPNGDEAARIAKQKMTVWFGERPERAIVSESAPEMIPGKEGVTARIDVTYT
ncbi:MAG: hypothetical protein AB199_03020 [Parcubacteria bacterium C7867-004]|nr:MAG: hypothetical protein AB199_03020 [Parcubacteria bacterium C7867-004]